MKKLLSLAMVLAIGVFCSVAAQSDDHDDDHDHGPLHFSHPLIVESPSPDTKVRFDYFFRRLRDAGEKVDDHTLRVEAEYAFKPWISIEVNAPLTLHRPELSPRETHTDEMEVSLKMASFRWAEKKLLPVYGVSFELPTGNGSAIGSDHVVHVEPYAGLGWMRNRIELVGFVSMGFPTNRRVTDDDGTELSYEFSYMYKANHTLQLLMEVDGSRVVTGPASGENVLNLSPGFKINHGHHWQFGFGAGFPVTGTKDFKVRTIASVFYHF